MKIVMKARLRFALWLRRLGWKIKPFTDHILYPGMFYKAGTKWVNPYTGKQ